ncbi:unnamed protein product [Rotaria sordida]|uniref:J domain-containing protein n=1 Tax=Rotaria sordida TaxID=392033 RepID=A0A815IV06_9BILA|nr:unnamed protein product [Rotaria sordida]CAF1320866.1 unnamed protein product [Rotaria sordida]CAF1329021.1 unnamed protein product [Rotaria sordida]CAF1373238.1 unnamed protein product [Rotaria sordida]CAF1545229.1 unnamed protein product [Rotaria sordida]
MSTAVVIGLGLAVVGFTGRYLMRHGKTLAESLNKTSGVIAEGLSSKYYKGGFDPKINRREAALILGVSPTASKTRIRDSYKRLIILNHPDRGGSPYIAAKINEAKDFFESNAK